MSEQENKIKIQDLFSELMNSYRVLEPMDFDIEGIPLAMPSFGRNEIQEAMDSLLSGWITMGKKVKKFEERWSNYVGSNYGVAVNSGSSALLVMLSAMIECGYLKRGQEIILPAIGWSTSLFSVVQAGLVPVLVDVSPKNICLEGEFEDPILAIHLLGAVSEARSPIILEDACGAHGAMLGTKKVGSIGACAAFSFFFSHHITTGEGGMITTSDENILNACRSYRAHGWIRERNDAQEIADQYPNMDPRFLFATMGFNLRMSDIAAAIGVHQVDRIEDFVVRRRRNHKMWCSWINESNLPVQVFEECTGTRNSAFAFPMIIKEESKLSRKEVCARLELKGIQTRPISGSHLARQPAWKGLWNGKIRGSTPVADAIHERGFFVGQSHAFGDKQGELLIDTLKDILG